MFSITEYKEDESVSITIAYTMNGTDRTDLQVFKGEKAKETAMRYFASSAFTYLNLQVDLFHAQIKKISVNYLNNEIVPYINNKRWTVAYWTYLELIRQLAKVHGQHNHYGKLVNFNIHLFHSLIPELHILGRKDLEFILADIEKTSKLLVQTIKKIQDGNFSENFAPVIKIAV